MKRILLLAAFLIFSCHTYAQLTVGPEMGLNLSNLKIGFPNFTFKNRLKTGFRAGLLLTAGTEKSVCLQTGFYFHNKGALVNGTYLNNYFASQIVLQTVQVPVYLTFQTSAAAFSRFFFGVGGYFDYHINGEEEVAGKGTELKIGSGPMDNIESKDYGLAATTGFRVNNGIIFRLQYQYGLPNISPVRDQTIKSRTFAITLAYIGMSRTPKAPVLAPQAR